MKNKGYTLVETIIVIAIIAILTGMAFATLGIINQAKYNTAATTLDTQFSSLLVKTKALSQAREQSSVSTLADSEFPLCMQISPKSDGGYAIDLGYNTTSGFVPKYPDAANAAIPDKNKREATLPDVVTIKYNESKASQVAPNADPSNEVFIVEFRKSDGTVKYGAGEYELWYDNRIVATIVLEEVTGNHYIK